MADDNRRDFWYSGKVTRRRLLGYGAATAGALGATMLVPAPWRPPSARPSPTRSARCSPCRAPAASGGKTALVGMQMAVDRINKTGGINGRPDRADRRRLRVQARRRPPQGREAAASRTRSTRTWAASSPTSASPACRCSSEHKVVNMIGVCLDTTHHHQQVQPLHLPPVRLRAVAGGGVRALPGQQDRQEVAHRLRRLCLGPVHQGRLRRGDQEAGRRGRRHHRHPARHRRHDAVPVARSPATSTACSASSSARTASPSPTRRSISA